MDIDPSSRDTPLSLPADPSKLKFLDSLNRLGGPFNGRDHHLKKSANQSSISFACVYTLQIIEEILRYFGSHIRDPFLCNVEYLLFVMRDTQLQNNSLVNHRWSACKSLLKSSQQRISGAYILLIQWSVVRAWRRAWAVWRTYGLARCGGAGSGPGGKRTDIPASSGVRSRLRSLHALQANARLLQTPVPPRLSGTI